MKPVTIGFLSRERFSFAARSLRSILERTEIPFNLIVVNNDIPPKYWAPVEQLLDKLDHVRVIRTDQLITANRARNLIVEESKDEYICFIENDNIVEKGWLAALIDACESLSADVAVPLILEHFDDSEIVHFDTKLGRIREVEGPNGEKGYQILRRREPNEQDRAADRRIIDIMEMHCMLFRRNVFDRIGPFDEQLRGTRQELDIALSLYEAGMKIAFEPKSVITFFPPPPIYPEEKAFLEFIWDVDAAIRNEEMLTRRWNLVGFPGAVEFAEDRLKIVEEPDPEKQIDPLQVYMNVFQETIHQAARDLLQCIPEGERLIMVDDMQWNNEEVAPGFRTKPFLERDGVYWGSPEDDETAIAELNRMRMDGEKFIAFGQPSFWWLEHYRRFSQYLHSNFEVLLENDRLVVFDLQTKPKKRNGR